ncbi:hypothetical protein ACOMHN_049327 [Nucella lapillus]
MSAAELTAMADWLLLPDHFCNSPFWDGNLTWNSSWPRFTDCFQKVALTGGPCALLWMTSLVYGYILMTSKDDVLPTGKLSSLKTTCCWLLMVVSVCELTLPEGPTLGLLPEWAPPRLTARTSAPILLILTVMLSGVLSRLEQQKGLRSSTVLFLFWLSLSVCQIVPLYTLVMEQKSLPDPNEPIWSRWTFEWMKELLSKGKAGELTENDIYEILPQDNCSAMMARLSPLWQKEVAKAREKNQADNVKEKAEDPEELLERLLRENKGKRKRVQLQRSSSVRVSENKAPLFSRCQSEIHHISQLDFLLESNVVEDENAKEKTSEESEEENGKKGKDGSRARPNFLLVMMRCFAVEFVIKQFFQALRTIFEMLEPILFGLFLSFLEEPAAPVWRGYVLCGLMSVIAITRLFLQIRGNFFSHRFAIRIKGAIANSVFQKALTMDTEARQESTMGQAVNLLSVDAGDISHAFTWMAAEMVCVPIRILASLFMLYQVLGSSMFISVVLLAVMVPLNSIVARKLGVFHRKLMDLKDDRLKILTEVINGVKILKMYAWEPSFIDKVNGARQNELDVLSRLSVWDSLNHFYFVISPYVVSITVFMMYVYLSEDHYLAPSVAFLAISVLDKLKNNMGTVPHIISHMIKVVVSFKRLNEFLGRNDLEDSIASDEEEVISIKSGFFTWSSGLPPVLKNINVAVKKGSLVAVVGTVGCGKSSLLAACLGELKKLKGKVSIKGSVAYVPQQAWIQHASLKDNVLFGQSLDDHLYQQCLDDCALRTDLDILPAGDLTEIGEKGINLSGGQKQRVSLARAAYSQADVYLLDDPLSAVDCHVGSHIFDKVIGHHGMLAGKTRVLVTHGVQWLPKVDQILVIRHGRLSESGSYEELLSHNGPFAKFLRNYLAHHIQPDADPMG